MTDGRLKISLESRKFSQKTTPSKKFSGAPRPPAFLNPASATVDVARVRKHIAVCLETVRRATPEKTIVIEQLSSALSEENPEREFKS